MTNTQITFESARRRPRKTVQGAGAPRGGPRLPHLKPWTPEDVVRRRYPNALLGLMQARERADLNYEQAGAILNVTPSQYGRYEKGQTHLRLIDAKRLADHFGLKVDDLF